MRCLAIILALALSGCAHARYIVAPCLTKDQVLPAEPTKVHDRLTGKADHDLPFVAGSALRLRAWGQSLYGILETCR